MLIKQTTNHNLIDIPPALLKSVTPRLVLPNPYALIHNYSLLPKRIIFFVYFENSKLRVSIQY